MCEFYLMYKNIKKQWLINKSPILVSMNMQFKSTKTLTGFCYERFILTA